MRNRITSYGRPPRVFTRFTRDENGSTLVELGIVLPIFLLVFFGLIDFGRMAFHYVTVEKAVQVAARVAIVRPPACPGVPQFIARGTTMVTPPPKYGTSCNADANICANPGVIQCAGSNSNATAAEVWDIVRGAFPTNATIANLSFSYSYDANMGFLGGPYTPVVSVEVQNLTFNFISPLGDLVELTGGIAAAGLGDAFSFPALSVSMPAEDLAMGNNG